MVEKRVGGMHSFVKRWWLALPPIVLVAVLWLPASNAQEAPPQEEETPVEEQTPAPPVVPEPPVTPEPEGPGLPPALPPETPETPEDVPPVEPEPPRRAPRLTPGTPGTSPQAFQADPRFPRVDPTVTVELDVPDSMPIRLLVDLVAAELQLNLLYDDELQGTVALRQHTTVTRAELYNILERSLQLKGFSLLEVEPSWKLVIPASRVPQWAEFGAESMMAIERISLQHADQREIQTMMVPFLSDNGMIVTLPDPALIYVIEYRERMNFIRQVIQDMDARSAITREVIEFQHARATEVGEKLINYLAARSQPQTRMVPVRQPLPGGGTRVIQTPQPVVAEQPPMIDVDAKTNRLVIVGTPQAVADLKQMIAIYDVPPVDFQVIKLYELTYVSASEVVPAMLEIGALGDIFGAATTTPARPQPAPARRPGTPQQPTVQQSGSLGGIGAVPRAAVLESQNALLVRASPAEHEQIRRVLETVDHRVDDRGMIRLITLHYRDPEEVAEILLTAMRGDTIDPRTRTPIPGREDAPTIVAVTSTNSIIVNATPAQHEQIRTIIAGMDIDQPQVLLEATLVEVTDRDDLDMGIEWEGWQLGGDARQGDGGVGSSSLGFSSRDPATGLRLLTSAGGGPTALGSGLSAAWLDDNLVVAVLRALQTKSNARVLSKPRLLVNNNEPGMIENLDEEPVQEIQAVTVGSTVTGFKEFVEAGTRLSITPHISEGNFLRLQIEAEVSTFTGVGTQGGLLPPPRSIRRVETLITVPNRRTIVIGGLHGRRQIREINQVPLLGDVPLLGELFKRRTTVNVNTKIYLFVKATILRETDFGDLLETTQEVRDIMPEDLQELDPSLTTEAAVREAERFNAVLRREREAEIRRNRLREGAAVDQREPEIPMRVTEIPVADAEELLRNEQPTTERVRPVDESERREARQQEAERLEAERREAERRRSPVITVPMNPE